MKFSLLGQKVGCIIIDSAGQSSRRWLCEFFIKIFGGPIAHKFLLLL